MSSQSVRASSVSAPGQVVKFGVFEADLRSGELRKSGIKIKLHDQPFKVLVMLLERPGQLITREEIQNQLWPNGTYVDFDRGLNNAVNRLREALGDSADSPHYIETLPRRGYRFLGSIEANQQETATQPGQPPELLEQIAIDEVRLKNVEKPRLRSFPWLVVAGSLVLVLSLLVALQFQKVSSLPSSRLFVLPPEGSTFNLIGDDGGSVALSPGGTRLAFVAVDSGGKALLWVRSLEKLMPQRIEGTDGASFPFWSPDGNSIGFFSEGKLKRVGSDGRSSPQTICDAPFGRGGSWNAKGVIIFAPDSHSGIYRVADSGGTPVPITAVDPSLHTSHRWPRFLPGGKHFIYLAVSHFNPADHNGVYFSSLEGKGNQLILSTNADAAYASGFLFFLRKDSFMAQRFDPESGQLQGEPHATPEQVLYDPTIWKAVFDASGQGVMAYQLGDRVRGNQFFWFDRTGKKLGAVGEPAFQGEPHLSPDGHRMASWIQENGYSHLWVYDLKGSGRMQITFGKYDNGSPIWIRNGSRILFSAKRDHYSIYEVDPHGAQPEHLLFDTGKDTWPLDVSSDGQFLLYGEGLNIGRAQSQLWVYPMSGQGRPYRLLEGEAVMGEGQFSPDGRWVTYSSNESGREEVYVVPFDPSSRASEPRSAALGGKWQISPSGGRWPKWRSDGRELFYLGLDNTLNAVPLTRSPEFHTGSQHALFRFNPGFYNISYDVSPDGNRFIINTAPQEKAAPVTVVENWLASFKN